MTRINKYNYLRVLQGNYGAHGWEDLTAADDTPVGRKEVRDNLKDYRSNEGGHYRIISRREPNPEFQKEK